MTYTVTIAGKGELAFKSEQTATDAFLVALGETDATVSLHSETKGLMALRHRGYGATLYGGNFTYEKNYISLHNQLHPERLLPVPHPEPAKASTR